MKSKQYKGGDMQSADLDNKIYDFLMRKGAKFPELALSARNESRTVKYAETRTVFSPRHFFA
ncbi:MAG TPA: hypothetical protein VIJ25_05555 [Methylococcales bacterium]